MNDKATSQTAVLVGVIVAPHGTKGQVKVDMHTLFPGRFAAGETLFLDGHSYRVQHSVLQGGERVVVKLEGIDNRTEAEGLSNKSLTVPQERVPSLPQGEYYHFQIIGMGVHTVEGEYLGKIAEILSTGANDVYVVKGEGGQLLIPALDHVIKNVDVPKTSMVVDLPEGLR